MSSEQPQVSVVLSTYNRGESLAGALESITNQEVGDTRFELIVVDNNSSDNTAAVVQRFAAKHSNVRYVFEGRQGLSYARNTGITSARAPIISFTDDDVRVAPNWVSAIRAAFDDYPEASYIGGKVLPRWSAKPPTWLDIRHWAPLAIQDLGEQPRIIDTRYPHCLVGANLSFRAEVFSRIGLFAADFQRVRDNIGSCEDHEFQIRVWLDGLHGIYSPHILVTAEVQGERFSKQYHRKWHRSSGVFHARMRILEMIDRNGHVTTNMPRGRSVLGIPAYLFREWSGCLSHWVTSVVSADDATAFAAGNRVRYMSSYLKTRLRSSTREPEGG